MAGNLAVDYFFAGESGIVVKRVKIWYA